MQILHFVALLVIHQAATSYAVDCHFGCKHDSCRQSNGICQYGCKLYYSGQKCDICTQCIDNSCTITGYCNTGCIAGFYGYKCLNDCPESCYECNRDFGTSQACSSCNVGYFYYAYYKSCYQCHSNCKTCSGYNTCYECVQGYYGESCQHRCPPGCQCRKSDGICEGTCYTGYTGLNCATCLDSWYKDYNNNCQRCTANCQTCTSNTRCTTCTPGHYGKSCQTPCSLGCNQWGCNIINGYCDCKEGFIGNDCSACIDRKFGSNCDRDCPTHCLTCSSLDDCDRCVVGSYGHTCQLSCSIHCEGGCDRNSGDCISCQNGYSGNKCCSPTSNCVQCSSNDKCSECKTGFFDTNCNKQCPINCNGLCYKESGDCISCLNGFFGARCEQECSELCRSCNSNGKCIACQDGYYEPNCDACPENCTTCASDQLCYSCKDGYFGTVCADTCLKGCNNCTNSQSCIKCKDGLTGTTCLDKCSSKCSACLINNPNICTTCARGTFASGYDYYNGKNFPNCNKYCSKYCLIGLCDDYTGNCKNGCISGYQGDTCQCPENCNFCQSGSNLCYTEWDCKSGFSGETCSCVSNTCNSNTTWYRDNARCCKCSSTCVDSMCDDSNTCTYGCINGFYDTNCLQRCLRRDVQCLTCTSSVCTQCLPGYFPSNEDGICTRCSLQCLNEKCSSSSGECLEGCEHGFWGYDCTQQCVEHCNTCDRTNGTCNLCDNGKYLRTCSNNCSDNCLNSRDAIRCDIDTGSCSQGCKMGTYGTTCQSNCNTCSKQECDWQTGRCSDGCNDTYFGEWCEHQCSNKCIEIPGQRRCISSNGTCYNGCLDGYFDHDCQRECGNNCVNGTCLRISGDCTDGCRQGFEGSDCAKALGQSSQDNTGVVAGAAAGAVVFLLMVVGVVVALLIIRRRKGDKFDEPDTSPAVTSHTNMAMEEMGPVYTNASAAAMVKSERVKAANLSNPLYDKHALHVSLANSLILESNTDTIEEEEPGKPQYQEPYIATPTVAVDADDTYYNAGAIKRLSVDKLAEFVANKTKYDLEQEFLAFPKTLIKPYAESQTANILYRNRYKGVYPYDFNRVKLQTGKSDYINASYIDGFRKKQEYIAALGPTDTTTNDYVTVWSMIWQEQVEKIVMLTNLAEEGVSFSDGRLCVWRINGERDWVRKLKDALHEEWHTILAPTLRRLIRSMRSSCSKLWPYQKMKCHQYWPDPETSAQYGDVSVTCMAEDTYAEFTVRTLSVSQNTTKRLVYHFHYTAWPDRGVPDDVTGLIEFRNKVIGLKSSLDGPTMVHCSAGVGRTGTFIGLDYLTQEGEETDSVDVFDCVSNLRQQRVWMVQTQEQYVYLHDAVVHSLTMDSKPIASDKFHEYMTTLNADNLHRKYSQLKLSQERKEEEEKQAVTRNSTYKNKNIPGADIPGDRYRPKLYLCRALGSCDYINAVYLNSFRDKNRYIVAQTPLTSTVPDFLTLLFQDHIACIVDMQPDYANNKHVGEYLPPDNQQVTQGDFKMKSVKVKSTSQFTLRRLTIIRQSQAGPEERVFHNYQYREWTDRQPTPQSPAQFITFIGEVEARAREEFEDGKILIHCLTGAERSCLFCAVSVMQQKMESEHELSVVNTVRQIQSRRSQAIPNKEQFGFCYQCIGAFLDTFNTYSNFAMRQ